MFKRRARPENVESGPHRPARPYRCPECGEAMRDMGVYFEPPRKADAITWERMQVLAEFGLCFHTEGSKVRAESLMGRPPARPNALRRRLISAINKSS